MDRRIGLAALAGALLTMTAATPALADFPYPALGPGEDYADLRTNGAPNDLDGASNRFKYAATADPANTINNARPTELNGVRGASVVDADGGSTAWQLTTGRPDVTIAVLDSGIEWDNPGAMTCDARRGSTVARRRARSARTARPARTTATATVSSTSTTTRTTSGSSPS
jgi:hypothetical protein